LAENASFDVLIDDIRPSVFAVGDDKKKGKERKRKGREGKVQKSRKNYKFVHRKPKRLGSRL